MPPLFTTREANWTDDREALLAVRHRVFVQEQKVPEEIEVDEFDPTAIHAMALDRENGPIGTARLLLSTGKQSRPIARIGRVAVLESWRRHGVGSALMHDLLRLAQREGASGVMLHAQLSSIPFYASLGFQEQGEIFEEANIPHREMHKDF